MPTKSKIATPTARTDVKQPADRQYGGWSKSKYEDLECPSGAWAQVRRPGMQGLVKAGVLESMDSLTAIVSTETIPKAEGATPAGNPGLDAQKISDAIEAMDKIVQFVVVQPKLLSVPTAADLAAYNAEHEDEPKTDPDDLRDPDAYYVDDIDIEDKTFIVNFAMGGTRDLERFRKESPAAVGSLPAGA